MTMLKAIETRYKGYRFRSRLEARWAVFFDALGIEYQYEPGGFEKEYGPGDVLRYLPDFLLPQSDTWVEVKGSDEAFKADAERMENILDWGSPLPGFTDSDTNRDFGKVRGLLVLGEIPDPTQWGFHLHPIIRHSKGLRQRYAWFLPGPPYLPIEVAEDQTLIMLCCVAGRNDIEEEVTWTTRSVFVPSQSAFPKVIEAYKAARSARFEHGETPR